MIYVFETGDDPENNTRTAIVETDRYKEARVSDGVEFLMKAIQTCM